MTNKKRAVVELFALVQDGVNVTGHTQTDPLSGSVAHEGATVLSAVPRCKDGTGGG